MLILILALALILILVPVVRLVRGEGRGVSDWYGVREAACPIGTG
jgi:hypothetical protein